MKLVPTSINPVTITLYQGIPFDNNYNEHTFLSTKFRLKPYTTSALSPISNNKEAFINMKVQGEYVYPRSVKSGTYNFAYGNGLVTSVVMELTDNEINSNYMKVVSGSDTYYYFITGILQKNEVTYLLNLELDVLMTYTDEFLDNIQNKEVFFERKHCRRILRTKTGTLVKTKINDVCFNQESQFSGIKPSIVEEMTPMEFKDFINGNNDFNELMSELYWIYIIVGNGAGQLTSRDTYRENGVDYPYSIAIVPSQDMKFIYSVNGVQETATLSARTLLERYIGQPSVQKIILSPFPPFKDCSNISMTKSGQFYVMNITSIASYGTNSVTFSTNGTTGNLDIPSVIDLGFETGGRTALISITLASGYGDKIAYKTKDNYFTTTLPSISDLMVNDNEYKLQISPFKDLRMSCYYGDDTYIRTEYLFLGIDYSLKPYTIVSCNAESNSYWNYVDTEKSDVSAKRGVTNSVAYNFPTGTNAELLYQQTAKSQYEATKTINSISNGFKLVAGGLGIGLGTSSRQKFSGLMSIGSGVVGEIGNQMSYDAKMVDLKSTPNSYNFAGSSYSFDKAVAKSDNNSDNNLLPYYIVYGVTDHDKSKAEKFLYNYGYEYNLESTFSTLITNATDNAFERRLFNYIKIREDISSKIVGANLPQVVAKKISDIFNAGIKLWTFFLFDFENGVSVSNIITRYFQREIYCNAELIGENL